MWKKHEYEVKYTDISMHRKARKEKKLKTRNEVNKRALRILAAILQLSRDALYSIYEVPTLHTKKKYCETCRLCTTTLWFCKKRKRRELQCIKLPTQR